jgi:hypothetical protein
MNDAVRGVTAEPCDRMAVIINVSDHPGLTFEPDIAPRAKKYWLPIMEVSVWPLAMVHAVIRTLHFHVAERKELTYIHCSGGISRSPCMATLWLIAEGHSRAEAMALVGTDQFEVEGRHGRWPLHIENFARSCLTMTTATSDVFRTVDNAGFIDQCRAARDNAHDQRTFWPERERVDPSKIF